MSLSRRSFLTYSAAVGALSPLLGQQEIAEALASIASGATSTHPSAGEIYWKSLYSSGAQRGRSGASPNEQR
ncbi:MAG TPA: twin-arginine translocation signal domain-containing protein, partial [Bryobacteraceae bacterium]